MNIFELYDNYRCQHSTEFRRLLEAVAKSVLALTEEIPEEDALEMFKTSLDREFVDCAECPNHPNYKEGFLFVGFNGATTYHYPYDDTAMKDLDRFMETYYPYIACHRSYNLNLYRRTIDFNFGFEIDYDGDEKASEKGYTIRDSIHLFNNDMAEVLQHELNVDDWDELHKCSFFYDYGAICVSIEIN